jgi:hypothetical protein
MSEDRSILNNREYEIQRIVILQKKLFPKLTEHYSMEEWPTIPPTNTIKKELWEIIPGHIPNEKR